MVGPYGTTMAVMVVPLRNGLFLRPLYRYLFLFIKRIQYILIDNSIYTI